MKIHRSQSEAQEPHDELSKKRTHETGRAVDLMIAVFDKMCPSVFLHVTVINEYGGGVSVSRTSDDLPEEMRSKLESINTAFATQLADALGGAAVLNQGVGADLSSLVDALDPS